MGCRPHGCRAASYFSDNAQSDYKRRDAALSRRAENVIPKRRTDAVSNVIVLEVMAEMILLQPKPCAAFHGAMVRRVMEHVITDITENQSSKHSRRQAPKNQEKQPIKEKRERDAYDWGHN